MATARLVGLGLVAALASCAHAPASAPHAAVVHPVFPPSPARAEVRWAASYPDPDALPEPPSRWRHFWEVVLGLDSAAPVGAALDRPFGLAVADGALYVADADARRVVRLDLATGRAAPITCAERAWDMPMAVAVVHGGAIYVADAGAAAVVRVAGGRCTVLGRGALERPTGVAVIGARIYVVDPPRHVVVVLDERGAEQQRFGGRGTGDGSLNFPTAIAALEDRALLVVDALNFRVSRYSAAGVFEQSFGEPGDGGGAFGRPKAVAVDGKGRIWVSDAQHDVALAFGSDGVFRFAVGGTGRGPGELALPAGLAASGDRLFVADTFNHRIQIYDLLGGAP